MNFRNIVSNINYSPNALWHLYEYDKENSKKIKKATFSILIMLINILILVSITATSSVNNSILNKDRDFTNYDLGSPAINKVLKTENPSFKDIESIYEEKATLNLLHSLITKDSVTSIRVKNKSQINKNEIEISYNNIKNNSKSIILNDNIFYYNTPSNILDKRYIEIATNTDVVKINRYGNFVVKNSTVNNLFKQAPNYVTKISVVNNNNKPISEISLNDALTLKIELKEDRQTSQRINLNDFLEYLEIISPDKNINKGFLIISPNDPNENKIFFKASYVAKNKKIKNLDFSYDCKASLPPEYGKPSIKVNCGTSEAIKSKLESIGLKSRKVSPRILIAILAIAVILKFLTLLTLYQRKLEIKQIRRNINKGIL